MRKVTAILCALWVTGIAFGVFSVPLTIIIGFCIVFSWFIYKSSFRPQVIIAGLAVVLLGIALGHTRSSIPAISCDTVMPAQAILTEIRGMYATHTLSVFKREDGCSILVYAPRYLTLIEGAHVHIDGKAEHVAEAFKGIPGYVKFLQEDGINLVVRNPHISILSQGASMVSEARINTMGIFEKVFREPDSSVLIAMMLGDRGMIPRTIADSFQKSGIIHILSISGFHVSLFAGVLALLFLRLPIPLWAYYMCVGAILWAYIIAVGAPPAAIRAGMFWTIVIIAYRMRALVGLPTIILLTLCFVVTDNPVLIRSIGFQLSVAAVTGIGIGVFFFRRIHVSPRLSPIAASLAVSLGATCATLPLTAYYFGTISLIGIFVNIIIVPVVAVLTYVALAALTLYILFEPLGLLLSFVTHILMAFVLAVADVAASIPYGSFQDVVFPLWAVVLYYGFIVGIILTNMKLFHIRFREIWV